MPLPTATFQLRGEDSDADEAFVRSLAALLEMPVYVKRFDVDREMEEKGISVQMAARDLRYEWFSSLALTHKFDSIATAHNLNDSVETFFLNLARGYRYQRDSPGFLSEMKTLSGLFCLLPGRKLRAYALSKKLSFGKTPATGKPSTSEIRSGTM